jgi:hypothetical protein
MLGAAGKQRDCKRSAAGAVTCRGTFHMHAHGLAPLLDAGQLQARICLTITIHLADHLPAQPCEPIPCAKPRHNLYSPGQGSGQGPAMHQPVSCHE